MKKLNEFLIKKKIIFFHLQILKLNKIFLFILRLFSIQCCSRISLRLENFCEILR